MLRKLYLLFTEKKVVLFTLVVTSLLILITSRIETKIAGSSGMGLIYMQISFTRQNFEAVVASWGRGGVELYLKTIWIDFLYPVFMAALLSSSAAYFAWRAKKNLKEEIGRIDLVLFAVPFVGALLDFAENILHVIILGQRIFTEEIIFTASLVSTARLFILVVGISWMLRNYFLFRKSMVPGGGR